MTVNNLSLLIFMLSLAYSTADIACPKNPILCKTCIKTCPNNQILVKSSCGCCYDQCAPKEKCPNPPIECLVCHWSCAANETMKLSPCGCCHNKCVPNSGSTSPKPVCPPGICSLVRCATPSSCPSKEQIIVQGAGYCGCCPGCVKPKKGDNCYKEVNTDKLICGPKLCCHHGKCL